MDYCFDTSAVNHLHDDAERKAIVSGFLCANRALVSELNLVEVMATTNAERRLSLCQLLKQLTRGNMPLLTPTTLLRKLTIAHLNGQSEVTITGDKATPEAWFTLHCPERCANEEAREFFQEEKSRIEDQFTKAHQRGRIEFPTLFTSEQRPRSLGQTLRFFVRNPLSFYPTAAACYEAVTNRPLRTDEVEHLFRDIPEWSLYLAGWAQGFYARGLQLENLARARTLEQLTCGLPSILNIAIAWSPRTSGSIKPYESSAAYRRGDNRKPESCSTANPETVSFFNTNARA